MNVLSKEFELWLDTIQTFQNIDAELNAMALYFEQSLNTETVQ